MRVSRSASPGCSSAWRRLSSRSRSRFCRCNSPRKWAGAPAHLRGELQRQNLDLLRELNRRHAELHPGEADLETRIASYELAARMQSSAREALDLSREPPSIQRLYGLD